MIRTGASIVHLDPEEGEVADEDLVALAQCGDDVALQTIFHRYRRRARAKARSYFLMGADREDVIQESLIGLFKAIRDYRPDQDVSFRSFAELCMRGQVISAIKRASRFKHSPLNLSTSLFAGQESDTTPPLLDRVPHEDGVDPVHVVIDAEEEDLLTGLLDQLLSPLERRVIDLLVAGKSYSEIAESLGRSTKSIDNAAQRIRQKLHHRIGGGAEVVTLEQRSEPSPV